MAVNAVVTLAAEPIDGPAGHINEQITTVLKSAQQHTLAAVAFESGIGLHTGQQVNVKICPAPANAGRYFVRTDLLHTDLPSNPTHIPAHITALHQTVLSTELRAQGASIRTVEHLLAALAGLGIDNVRIEVDGPEIPILDGSAQDWVQAILKAGWTAQSDLRQIYTLERPITVQLDDAFVTALPAEQTRFTYGIDFPYAAIGQQWCSIDPDEFGAEIAPARTFGLAETIEQLRGDGLIKGGSLENALVCSAAGWLNPPLRYSNEPVRHKLLDLVGDLSLLGPFPRAHILAYKASHRLHAQLVERLFDLVA